MYKKKTSFSLVCVLCASLFLSACAGRSPQLVPVVSPSDRFMNCDAVMIEIQANNKKITELAAEKGGKTAQNIVAGTVGLVLFFPALFLMDFQGTAEKETAALQSRQQYLATLAESKKCSEEPTLNQTTTSQN